MTAAMRDGTPRRKRMFATRTVILAVGRVRCTERLTICLLIASGRMRRTTRRAGVTVRRTADREARWAVLGRAARPMIGPKSAGSPTAGAATGGGAPAAAERSADSAIGAMATSTSAPAVRARRVDGRDSSASVIGPGHSRESHDAALPRRLSPVEARQWEPGHIRQFRRPCQHTFGALLGETRRIGPGNFQCRVDCSAVRSYQG